MRSWMPEFNDLIICNSRLSFQFPNLYTFGIRDNGGKKNGVSRVLDPSYLRKSFLCLMPTGKDYHSFGLARNSFCNFCVESKGVLGAFSQIFVKNFVLSFYVPCVNEYMDLSSSPKPVPISNSQSWQVFWQNFGVEFQHDIEFASHTDSH